MTPETREIDVSKKLTTALLTPLLLLIAVATVLGLQLQHMSDDASWVDHTDEVIALTSRLQKQIVDQETGIRGYLITGDRAFLEPYERARPLETLVTLRTKVADNPSQGARVDEVRRGYEAWLASATPVAAGDNPAPFRSLEAMRGRKQRMDHLRGLMDALADAESELKRSRAETAEQSTRVTRVLFVGLFLTTAAVLAFLSRRQLASITRTYDDALEKERLARLDVADRTWVRTAQMKVTQAIQGDLSIAELGERVLAELAHQTGAEVGAFFVADGPLFRRRAGYALDPAVAGPDSFGPNDGLLGRAVASTAPVHVRDVPAKYLRVRSGLGEASPVELTLVSARSDGEVHAVIELGFFRPIERRALAVLELIGEPVGVAVRSAEYKARLRDLLEESQRQGEELQTQQEELRVTNEELEEQTSALRAAQAQLEERSQALQETNARLERQSSSLQAAQQATTEKAKEVERASRYKSEFLANMSHELRTPLNSTLILAKLLADNREGNLTAEQVKFAQTISSAGNDLLTLINDILDLSKIEAGKVEVHPSTIFLAPLTERLRRMFEPIAAEKKLAFVIERAGQGPDSLETDEQRLEQILKNLLSNALKFTDHGQVSMVIETDSHHVRFAVKDTGIGIAREQQSMIFEAFRQADGTSNRKYGGTGLGLSISRDLAALLGGSLEVASEVSKGSTFTLTLPCTYVAKARASMSPAPLDPLPAEPLVSVAPPAPIAPARLPRAAPASPLATLAAAMPPARATGPRLEDDREKLDPERRLILVVEDDVAFARILSDLAHELAFQCIVALDADEGMELALAYTPSAVVLDMKLPDHLGLTVLDQLKRNPTTRHIPVHVLSSTLEYARDAFSMGAIGYIQKPSTRDELASAFRKLEERLTLRLRRLLIVEDDATQREAMSRLLEGQDVQIVAVSTVREALAALEVSTFDCVVTDLLLPDSTGFELIEHMGEDHGSVPPVIVYTGRTLTTAEEQRLRKHSSSIIVKGARSPERLLDEVTLFLHQVEADLPPERQRMLRQARHRESVFAERHILVVEDDVRNIFALTSVLEPLGAKVLIARNGREGIEALQTNPRVDLVLMDIMMPEMDGLTAMRHIRSHPQWAKLPILALTAKAMGDDRQKCLEAGASDYISKPLDVEKLLSLLRVWMPK